MWHVLSLPSVRGGLLLSLRHQLNSIDVGSENCFDRRCTSAEWRAMNNRVHQQALPSVIRRAEIREEPDRNQLPSKLFELIHLFAYFEVVNDLPVRGESLVQWKVASDRVASELLAKEMEPIIRVSK
jgi:hypothetical protein